MYSTFDSTYEEFIYKLSEFAGRAWENAPQRREAHIYKEKAETRLLKLIPPKKRSKAKSYLEDLDASYTFEINFYYDYAMKDCTRLLKLLGIL